MIVVVGLFIVIIDISICIGVGGGSKMSAVRGSQSKGEGASFVSLLFFFFAAIIIIIIAIVIVIVVIIVVVVFSLHFILARPAPITAIISAAGRRTTRFYAIGQYPPLDNLLIEGVGAVGDVGSGFGIGLY